MKMPILIISLLVAPFALGDGDPFATENWLSEGLARQIPKFQRTTFTRHPHQKEIIAANCESDQSWSGRLRVVHLSGDKIDWIANEPESYTKNRGHYVLSCEWRYLEKIQLWTLEVFDSTHRGNGSLWLFALEGHDLRLLLHTTALGHFLKSPADLKTIPPYNETRLVGPHLKAEYRAPKAGAAEAVFLTGTSAAVDDDDTLQSTAPFSETWTWDAGTRTFTLQQP